MGRHANGKNTFAMAWWVVALLIAVSAALVFGAVWIVANQNDSKADATAQPAAPSRVESTVASTTQSSAPSSSSVPEATSSEMTTSEAPSSAPAPAPAQAQLSDTLFLLDTSAAMAQAYPAVAPVLADAARQTSAAGHAVALWNYSSPLSATARVGYRNNVGFGPGEPVAQAVTMFGTGGYTHTRSAVVAALAHANEHAKAADTPTRVLLITSGTEPDMDDAEFRSAVSNATGGSVQLAVIHVGDTPDEVLKDTAGQFAEANAADSNSMRQALTTVAGIMD
ncbi:vWA domain-containing protein [Corynebacterium lizhenjunii]|nr:vWA domain-containing protein [Corynebacterium lizhenjunii]